MEDHWCGVGFLEVKVDSINEFLLGADANLAQHGASPFDTAPAKTWVRGMKATIVRGNTVQIVGYFEWGSHDQESAAEFVNNSEPLTAIALKPLEEWIHQVDTSKLPLSTAQPTMCGTDPMN